MKPGRAPLGWTLIVLVWLPMAALLVWGKGGVLDLVALRKEVRKLQEDVSGLERENARIRAEIQKLQTEPSAYEAVARERFFLKKPGERVLYIPGDGVPSQGDTVPGTSASPAPAPTPAPAPPSPAPPPAP